MTDRPVRTGLPWFALTVLAGGLAIAIVVEAEGSLQSQVPIAELEGIRNAEAALDVISTKVPLIQGQIQKWKKSNRQQSAIVTDQVELETRRHAGKTRLALDHAASAVIGSLPSISGKDELEIQIVKQAHL